MIDLLPNSTLLARWRMRRHRKQSGHRSFAHRTYPVCFRGRPLFHVTYYIACADCRHVILDSTAYHRRWTESRPLCGICGETIDDRDAAIVTATTILHVLCVEASAPAA